MTTRAKEKGGNHVMAKRIDYIILRDEDPVRLQFKVIGYLKQGFSLAGGVSCSRVGGSGVYAQAIYLLEKV